MIMNPTHFCFHNPQWTSVGFIIKKKTVTTIVFLSIRKELKEKILSESGAWPFAYSEPRISLDLCALRNGFPFPFKLNGMWSWRQFSFRFWTNWNSFWFKIEGRPVAAIISRSMWGRMEVWFSQCSLILSLLLKSLNMMTTDGYFFRMPEECFILIVSLKP